jgi:hypothetical protein
METYSYKVMGYAESELSAAGCAFAVVVYMPGERHVRGYVLGDWRNSVGEIAPEDHNLIEGFLADLDHCCYHPGVSANEFFDCLNEISVGSVRLLYSGYCGVSLTPSSPLADRPLNTLTSESFADLLIALERFGRAKPETSRDQ